MGKALYKYVAKAISDSPHITSYFNRALQEPIIGSKLIRSLHDKFILPGHTIDKLVQAGISINSHQIYLIADLLGEDVTTRELAMKFVDKYAKIAKGMDRNNVNGYISMKGSMIGQALNYDGTSYNVNPEAEKLFYDNMVLVLNSAKGRFVRLDAEHLDLMPSYFRVYSKLRKAGYNNLGLVLQANARRSYEWISELKDELQHLKKSLDVRLVKGAYSYSSEDGYRKKSDTDENYKSIINTIHRWNSARHVVDLTIGSHDPDMIAFAECRGFTKFEFLRGIADKLKNELVKAGKKVGEYTPIDLQVGGRSYWFPYFTRRLGEHPANLIFLLKHMKPNQTISDNSS